MLEARFRSVSVQIRSSQPHKVVSLGFLIITRPDVFGMVSAGLLWLGIGCVVPGGGWVGGGGGEWVVVVVVLVLVLGEEGHMDTLRCADSRVGVSHRLVCRCAFGVVVEIDKHLRQCAQGGRAHRQCHTCSARTARYFSNVSLDFVLVYFYLSISHFSTAAILDAVTVNARALEPTLEWGLADERRPHVDKEDSHTKCQAICNGVEGVEWENLYCKFVEMKGETRIPPLEGA